MVWVGSKLERLHHSSDIAKRHRCLSLIYLGSPLKVNRHSQRSHRGLCYTGTDYSYFMFHPPQNKILSIIGRVLEDSYDIN